MEERICVTLTRGGGRRLVRHFVVVVVIVAVAVAVVVVVVVVIVVAGVYSCDACVAVSIIVLFVVIVILSVSPCHQLVFYAFSSLHCL